MAISVELSVNGTTDSAGCYITWSPAPCSLRMLDADGAVGDVRVTLRNATRGGGRLEFRRAVTDPPTAELVVPVPANGRSVSFFMSGRFGSPSVARGDAPVLLRRGTEVVASTPITVRIRKNAENLTPAERDRFLSALAMLNDQGRGPYQSFRDTHTDDTTLEAHGAPGFIPWHRAYVLDLERELQAIDPSVTLPYWRFDQASPKLFTANYLGAAGTTGALSFAPSNPLKAWSTDGVPGITRIPLFDTRTGPASNSFGPVVPESATVGSALPYADMWRPLEGNPHGRSDVSFRGFISQIGTAVRDPLFFLLHCNVDRLWAKWQWFQRRFDARRSDTYELLGRAGQPGAGRIGHNLLDTMWPWNNITGGARPNTAPRTPFPPSLASAAPGGTPDVEAMIDFQGHRDPKLQLGFDYDDVPYEPLTP